MWDSWKCCWMFCKIISIKNCIPFRIPWKFDIYFFLDPKLKRRSAATHASLRYTVLTNSKNTKILALKGIKLVGMVTLMNSQQPKYLFTFLFCFCIWYFRLIHEIMVFWRACNLQAKRPFACESYLRKHHYGEKQKIPKIDRSNL